MRRLASRSGLARRPLQISVLLSWVPVVIGAAYLIVFAAKFPRLIVRVYWDSDAATAAVIAETADGGTVVLERFGWFTSLWFALLTKPLPFHREVWEVAPYLFALGSVALLAWASWRLAGSWAAAMTATLAVAVSPFVNYSRVTLNFHTATWVATVVVAVFALWLAYGPPTERALPAGVLVTALAGTTLASDRLFAFVAVLPLAVTGLLLLLSSPVRRAGAIALGSAAASIPIAWGTTWVMDRSNVEVLSVRMRFAEDTDLLPNVGRSLRMIVQLANGDYFFDAELGVRSSLSFVCAVLVLAALAAPFVLVRREMRSKTPSRPLLAYAAFWATCLALNAVSFVLSSEGTHTGHYFTPILYAVAATMPIASSRTPVRRMLAGIGIALVATTSLVNLADSTTQLVRELPPVATVADRIVSIAERENALVGYADYWDSAGLTWSKDLAIRVYPVVHCVPGTDALCPIWFNAVSTWYRPRAGKSFVLRDSASVQVAGDPPLNLGPPSATYVVNDTFTLFVYPYDVASRFDYSSVTWRADETRESAPPSRDS